MQILGNLKDWKKILQAAFALQVKHLFFHSPHTIFMVSEDGDEYVYADTAMFISRSLIMPESTMKSIKSYLKVISQRSSEFDTLNVTEKGLFFSGASHYPMELDVILHAMPKDFDQRMRNVVFSQFNPNQPYFRFSAHDLKQIKSLIQKVKPESWNRAVVPITEIKEEEDRTFLYFDDRKMRQEVLIEGYAFSKVQPEKGYRFDNKGFYLFNWLSIAIPIDEGMLIPKEEFTVFEGYMSNMVIKVRTRMETVEK